MHGCRNDETPRQEPRGLGAHGRTAHAGATPSPAGLGALAVRLTQPGGRGALRPPRLAAPTHEHGRVHYARAPKRDSGVLFGAFAGDNHEGRSNQFATYETQR